MTTAQTTAGLESRTPLLIVVGELNVDIIFEQVNQLPALERERISEGLKLVLGSSSAILACNASAMDLPVGFVGCIGDDLFGKYVIDQMTDAGVRTDAISVNPELATGATVIYTQGQQRGMITHPGAMDSFTIKDISWDYVAQGRHLHVSSLFLQRGLRPDCEELFRKAHDLGLSTSLDTGWDPAEKWGADVMEVLGEVDYFFPNEDEAHAISGLDDTKEALDKLCERAGTVVITQGENGVLAGCGSERFSVPSVAVDAVDAVGAGDSFNAGFLAAILGDASLEDAVWQGVLAGAYSTKSAGGTAAFRSNGFDAYQQAHPQPKL